MIQALKYRHLRHWRRFDKSQGMQKKNMRHFFCFPVIDFAFLSRDCHEVFFFLLSTFRLSRSHRHLIRVMCHGFGNKRHSTVMQKGSATTSTFQMTQVTVLVSSLQALEKGKQFFK
jgi:hypothetical protein